MSNSVFYRYRFFYGNAYTDDTKLFRITAAVRNAANGKYHIGFSFCNEKDLKKWDKKQARELSEQRLDDKKTVVTVNQREVDLRKGVFNAALYRVMMLEKRPQWFPVKLWNFDVETFDLCLDKTNY